MGLPFFEVLMPKMRVVKRHTWNERTVQPKEEYIATEDEALLVEALGWAERVEYSQPRQNRAYRRRDMTAEK
jgi:hypothetical protein